MTNIVTIDELSTEMIETFLVDPSEQAAFEAMLASVPFDLTATDTTSMFAPVLAEVEKSEVFSAETKTRLRNIVTGTDVQDALAEKNPDGSFKNTEDNKREFRTGVSGYTEPSGRQIIEATPPNKSSRCFAKQRCDYPKARRQA